MIVSPFLIPRRFSSSNTPIAVRIFCNLITCSVLRVSVTPANLLILPPTTINPSLAKETRIILEENKAERHIRGGEATKNKYKNLNIDKC